jgi:hypothetical protein
MPGSSNRECTIKYIYVNYRANKANNSHMDEAALYP